MTEELIPLPSQADTLTPIFALVLDAVPSPTTKRAYGKALADFVSWLRLQPERPPFNRACVQRYRTHLEADQFAAASINQKLSALRKLAQEAAYAGRLDQTTAQGIRDVKGASKKGVRVGNWLTKHQTEETLRLPDASTLKGKRDRAILAMLIGCGIRRDEAARLTVEHLGLRDGRWCIVDLVGKHGRIRTVPMLNWAKSAVDHWTAAAGITSGRLFRGVNKGDHLTGESLSSQGIFRCVQKYGKVSPHDLRRTFAKLCHKGGAKLDQIQLSLGHASIKTTELYLGIEQDLTDAPADYLHLNVKL